MTKSEQSSYQAAWGKAMKHMEKPSKAAKDHMLNMKEMEEEDKDLHYNETMTETKKGRKAAK